MILLPVRCWTCGKLLCSSNVRVQYVNLLSEGVPESEALDKCGLRKYCCRRMLLSHVEISDEIMSHCRHERNDVSDTPAVLPPLQ